MAGMDWFRWHHGSVTDPKFALVARKSGASLPDVLAVWCYILETASQSVERGDFGIVDCEALDCVFEFPATETRTADILQAMQDRDLTTGTRIAAWEKRQPKREREDATNADRQATFKAKQNQVTPDNTNDNQKTPRVEESREDKNKEDKKDTACRVAPLGVCDSVWFDFLKIRRAKKSPMTKTALAGIQREADTAGVTLEFALKTCCERGWVGFKAEWLTTPQVIGFAKPSQNITVPSRQERDPELTRIDIERSRSVPMPQNIREQMQKLKFGVPA